MAKRSRAKKKIERPVERPPDPDPVEPLGLECVDCGCRHFFVVYTRPWSGGTILRRRECRNCGRRIVTIEK